METIRLLGLDFGSTTSSALAASAKVLRNSATGRMELCQPTILFRSERAFTPVAGNEIDEQALSRLLDQWLREAALDSKSLGAGGVIITGLAAQKNNVATIKALVKDRVGCALFATADDPCLESWLAFMGSCLGLSRSNPEAYILNLDIGGGTTNLALGRNGDVLRTGCLLVGARHFQVVPGTYRLQSMSAHAAQLLHDLKIDRHLGEELAPAELKAIVDFYVSLIESEVEGATQSLQEKPYQHYLQAPFDPLPAATPVITLSGGVGELVYRQLGGEPLPEPTAFGDLGIDLAERLMRSPLLSRSLKTHIPENGGHATVFGICLYGTEISGATLYLPEPELLPLPDLPIVGRINMETGDRELQRVVDLVRRSRIGACIQIELASADAVSVKKIGLTLAAALRNHPLSENRALVLFVSQNVGKSLGSYASSWGRLPVKLIVVDEIDARTARFASLGAMRDNVVPVSLYGLQ